MKKLLFLLLLSIYSYGQTLQNPTFGVVTEKNNLEDNTALKVKVQDSNGKSGWVYKSNLVPQTFSKVVYVNNVNPNSATIFDTANPPVTNNNSLKNDANNLYISSDYATWVYSTSTLNYVTKTISSNTSNFYLSGTTTDAGNGKTNDIYRLGKISIGISQLGVTGYDPAPIEAYGSVNNRLVYGRSNLIPTSGVTMIQGIAMSQNILEGTGTSNSGYSISGYNVNNLSSLGLQSHVAQSSDTGTQPLIIFQGNRLNNSGSVESAVITRPILGVSNYNTRLMTMASNGNTTFSGNITSNSFIKTGGTATQSLLANGGVLNDPIGGTGTLNYIPKFASSGVIISSALFNNGTLFGFNTSSPSTTIDFNFKTMEPGMQSLITIGENASLSSQFGLKIKSNSSTGVFGFYGLNSGADSSTAHLSINRASGVIGMGSLSGLGDRVVVADSNGNLSATTTYSSVKRYKALLSQSGTSAPVATVLENTLGGTVVWSRTAVGNYYGTLAGAFPASKTFTMTGITTNNSNFSVGIVRASDNAVFMDSFTNGVLTDSNMNGKTILIEVYP